MDPQKFTKGRIDSQASAEDIDSKNNDERGNVSDYKMNESLNIMNGTYVCTNCDAELFSSSARVIAEKGSCGSSLDFSHAICKDVILRSPVNEMEESFSVCFRLNLHTFTLSC